MNRVCEAFELVKEAEMEKFGEKSYFYCKTNGLPSADSDNDPDPAICAGNGNIYAFNADSLSNDSGIPFGPISGTRATLP